MSEATMKKQNSTSPEEHFLTDPVVFTRIMMDVAQRCHPIIKSFLEKEGVENLSYSFDPLNISPAYIQFFSQLWSNPGKIAELQTKYWADWMGLFQESTKKFLGHPAKTLYEPDKADKRFKASAWQESAFFDFIKQSYLLTSQWLDAVVRSTDNLDEETRHKVDFYTRQFINAIAPSNFLITNPEALRETIESKGDNLVKGLEHLLADIERGKGILKISTTDYNAFEVGHNIAVTPGKVVWQNDIMQLIQYTPSTERVFSVPLLVVPPWINKYYILDLKPENSLINWLVHQSHTVFIISWVNPDQKQAGLMFEDYMHRGLLEAMDKVREATGAPACNLMGYCIGGTLMAITLAWLAAHKREKEVVSATFLTTLVDFENAGDLKLFVDDKQIEMLEQDMAEKGYLDADTFVHTFSLLRANDMIWSFVVNNYLMGREPFPFDLLYWNEDATNMPAALHSFYLRKFYRDNLLSKPGGVSIDKTPIDVGKIKTPCYFLSTKEDHIAPWKATYMATKLFGGPVTFTLAASGHVAGIVNPPDKNKYCYWTASKNPANPDQWIENATQKNGSWWPAWQKWVEDYTGNQISARKPGGKLKPIEDAPGSYVRKKAT